MKTIRRALVPLLILVLLIAFSHQESMLSVKDALSGLVLLCCLFFLLGRSGGDSGHDHGW